MASEREFLRRRLALVEQSLAHPEDQLIYDGKGLVRRPMAQTNRLHITEQREARLLRKLLVRACEGRTLAALEAWRRELAGFLTGHRRRYRKVQEAYDRWWQLAPYQREGTPQPPRPPSARYVDREGAPWIIDDQFLALLDDLVERLRKWRSGG